MYLELSVNMPVTICLPTLFTNVSVLSICTPILNSNLPNAYLLYLLIYVSALSNYSKNFVPVPICLKPYCGTFCKLEAKVATKIYSLRHA